MRAVDFLDTLGAGTHHTQGFESVSQIESALEYTGIRHIRDDGTSNADILADFCAIHAATGETMSELPWGGDLTDTLNFLDTLGRCGALLDVEGQNEPNNQNFNYNGQLCSTSTSFLPCAQFQAAFYAAAKNDPNLADLPMFAETEPGAEPDEGGLQYLTIPSGAGTLMPDGTVFADYANLHNYVRCNGCNSVVDNQAWNAESTGFEAGSYDGLDGEFINQTWSKHFPAASVGAGPSMPRVTTESGWPTDGSITADQQGKLLSDLYLTAAARGWSYTFVYSLIDDGTGCGGYGMFCNASPPTAKPAAIYVHNLTTILNDTNSGFTSVALGYSIPSAPPTVHSLLMQKGDGTYELAVWDDRPVGEGSDAVTVNLGRTFATVNEYDVTVGSSPVKTISNASSVELTLSDHAMILEMQ